MTHLSSVSSTRPPSSVRFSTLILCHCSPIQMLKCISFTHGKSRARFLSQIITEVGPKECPSPYQSTNRDANDCSEYEFSSQKSPGANEGLIANEKTPARAPKISPLSMTMTATVTTAIITPSSPPVGSYSSVSHDLFNS
ncbi:unnamed protein product [Allacma fusca]|uniref:Uncharacterized protein n=1 Tax=Allacma fusca TaxID=39272 RepID=A0A8J2Q6K2_9HEXA|nr:unnamed protein product [Allacma fusca]